MQSKTWKVEIFLAEDDDATRARAVLHTGTGPGLQAEGLSRHNPHDPQVPEIGDEVAVARALTHLGEQLLGTAESDISAVTGDAATLIH